MVPPPEQVSHESQPDICSMPLIVVPAEVGVGLGDGFGLAFDEPDGGGATVLEDPGVEAAELLEPAGPEFDAVAGAGADKLVLAGVEPVPPHPAITTRIVPAKPALNAKRGTERISQF